MHFLDRGGMSYTLFIAYTLFIECTGIIQEKNIPALFFFVNLRYDIYAKQYK